MKITVEQLQSLTELLKTKSRKEIALEWGVAQSAINYWVKKLREKGAIIENKNKNSLINEITI